MPLFCFCFQYSYKIIQQNTTITFTCLRKINHKYIDRNKEQETMTKSEILQTHTYTM